MDTRFWGPSGWQLLHSITNKYPNNPDKLEKDAYEIFFKSLPFILPCIYCRNSLTEYYINITKIKLYRIRFFWRLRNNCACNFKDIHIYINYRQRDPK